MGGFKDLIAEIRTEFDKLEAGAATRLHGLLDRLIGDGATLETEAKADAEQVAHDAEAAAAPVVTEAAQDAENVAKDAATDVEQAATTN